jgi:hypothetical protein
MDMTLVKTTISATDIRMRYADHANSKEATEWIDFQVPLEQLMIPDSGGDNPVGDPELRFLGSVDQAALRYVRELISAEIQRLGDRVSRRA